MLISRLLNEHHLSPSLPALISGLVAGILVVMLQISFAALIFSGDLSEHLSSGIGMMLFGAFVIGTVVAVTSSFPGAVACLQGSPAVVLAIMTGAVASGMPVSASSDDTFITIVVAIGLTSLLTGLFFWGLGRRKLGSLIRFVPYPVSGGFLAGTGLLLIVRAMGVMTESPLSFFQLSDLLQSQILIKWLPGVIFAVILFVIQRRSSNTLIMPGMIALAMAAFYALLLLSETPLAQARTQGLLLGPFPSGSIWRPLSLSEVYQVNWTLVFSQIGEAGTILIISVICLLFNASGLELTVQRDIDLNRELQSTGLANIFSGLSGGPVGYSALSLSVLGHKMGTASRLTGVISAALCGAMLLFNASFFSYLPRPLLGGLLFFLGLSFLVEWLYDAWFKISKADYVIVLLILFVIGVRGFLDGVGTGVVITVILFVVKYSGIDVVKQALSGADSKSNVDRPIDHRKLLREKGEGLFILRLQGYIFFGTAHNLYRRVRDRAEDPGLPNINYVVLDCARVTGLDSSAEFCFLKMLQLADSRDIKLVFTQMTPDLQKQLKKAFITSEHRTVLRIFPDQDHGVEWCENQILISENVLQEERKQPLFSYLERSFPETVEVARIMGYLDKREVEEGYCLMRQGEASDGLYFIESGQVIAQVSSDETSQDESVNSEAGYGRTARLRAMRPGSVVGEVGMYLGIPRTASVVANRPSTLYYLSSEALMKMEEKDPALASAFHQFIARLLAERLSDNSRTIQALCG
jgi:SulP family sulfate permease